MSFQPKGTISRVTKSGIRRTSSPFAKAKRKKSTTATQRAFIKPDSVQDDTLPDAGQEDVRTLRTRLAPSLNSTNVTVVLRYVPTNMFASIPERASGMNSVRIADVLNYRIRLPPVVSVAHVHALTGSPTATDREIASLIHHGLVRKLAIPGRGSGASAIGHGLVLVSEWERLVQSNEKLSKEIKEKYISHLRNENPSPFTVHEIKTLSMEAFLTASSLMPSVANTFLRPGALNLGSLSFVAKAGAKNASGSEAAVATSSVQHIIGGTRTHRLQAISQSASNSSFTPSLPNMGPYLRLVADAREHLLSILTKSGPFKSLPLERLKERWEGGGADPDSLSPHERRGLLPGRTKKWREFNGLQFEYILAECLGAGLVECFKSAGTTGIRALR